MIQLTKEVRFPRESRVKRDPRTPLSLNRFNVGFLIPISRLSRTWRNFEPVHVTRLIVTVRRRRFFAFYFGRVSFAWVFGRLDLSSLEVIRFLFFIWWPQPNLGTPMKSYHYTFETSWMGRLDRHAHYSPSAGFILLFLIPEISWRSWSSSLCFRLQRTKSSSSVGFLDRNCNDLCPFIHSVSVLRYLPWIWRPNWESFVTLLEELNASVDEP